MRLENSCTDLQNPSFEIPLCYDSQCHQVPQSWESDNATLIQSTSILVDQKALLFGRYLRQSFHPKDNSQLFVFFSANSAKGSSVQVEAGFSRTLFEIPQGNFERLFWMNFYATHETEELSFVRTGDEPIALNNIQIVCKQLPQITVSSGTFEENSRQLVFEASLSSPSLEEVAVTYEIVGTGKISTFKFPLGLLKTKLVVPVEEENIKTEFVKLRLLRATFASILVSEAQGRVGGASTVTAKAPVGSPPLLTVTVANGTEGDIVQIFLSLSQPALGNSIQFSTAGGTAISGVDFEATNGQIDFVDGETEAGFWVAPIVDLLYEHDESFSIIFSNEVDLIITTHTYTAWILNADPMPLLTLSSMDSSAESATPAYFQVNMSSASGLPCTVTVSYANGTAKADADFNGFSSFTTTIPTGETDFQLLIPISDDVLNEDDEFFTINLSDPINCALDIGSTNYDILDNDPLPTISLSPASFTVSEDSAATLTVTLSAISGRNVTVAWDIQGESDYAFVGLDFSAFFGTVVILEGNISQDFVLPMVDDALNEEDDIFSIFLHDPISATLGSSITSVMTIADNDPLPECTIEAMFPPYFEHDLQAPFLIKMSSVLGRNVTFQFTQQDGTATAGLDYVFSNVSVTIPVDFDGTFMYVPLILDVEDEDTETFLGVLESADYCTITVPTSEAAILDEFRITISAPDFYDEASDGMVPFNITLDAPAEYEITVNYRSVDGTARASSDYLAVAGQVIFPPGTTWSQIIVSEFDDINQEAAEYFTVVLSNATGAVLGTSAKNVTLIDNDGPPMVDVVAQSSKNENAGTCTFFVTLLSSSNFVITVDYATSDGTATAGLDYVATSGTAIFAPEQTTVIKTVPILQDSLDEASETFFITISNAVNATVTTPFTAQVIIVDDDPFPTINFTSIPQSLDESSGTVNISVTANNPSGRTMSVHYATADVTAVAGNDYVASSGTLTWAAGEVSKNITVALLDDFIPESSKIFTVRLTTPTNLIIGNPSSQNVTITDADVSLVVFITGGGNFGESSDTVTLTVALSFANADSVMVQYATSDGTATAGSDYTAVSGALIFEAGETSKNVSVSILSDTFDENDESFTVTLSSVVNATLSTSTQTVVIVDDDPAPTISITGGGMEAEDVGTVTLTVSLDSASAKTITVDYATSDGTTTAGSDYTALSGTLTFNAGETSKTLTLSITDDSLDETDETLSVTISNPSNAVLGTSSQTVTITDNDPSPSMSISANNVVAENSGNVVFTISLDAPSAKTISVDYETVDGSASSGSDYTAVSGTLTFSPSETSKTVSVTISDDSVDEDDETFSVTLSNYAAITTSSKTVTITDDDVIPTVSISGGVNAAESIGSVTLTVSLNTASGKTVTVDYATSDGTATDGSDYTCVSGTLTFNAGETSKSVFVSITDDSLDESSETFTVTISNPSNAAIGTTFQTVTIADNENSPGASIYASDSAAENAGEIIFTVSLDAASAQNILVDYATSDGTATAGSDYTAVSGTLTFFPGETVKNISVSISDDYTDENDETLTVALSNYEVLGNSTKTVSIIDDDSAPTISISGGSSHAENAGTVTLTVSLDAASAKTITVGYATSDDTTTDGSDYTALSGTLTFNAGETIKTLTLSITDDSLDENDETLSVTISNPTNAVLGTSSETVTITDNDPSPFVSISGGPSTAENAGTVTLTVSLDSASAKTITVDYATSDDTATDGSDYTCVSGTLTFNDGETSKTFTVSITDDSLDESSETFTVTISNPSNAIIDTSSQTITITDNDAPPTVSISASNTVAENVGDITLTVSLDAASGQMITINFATTDGTASSASDYTAASGTLTFSAGETTKTILVSIGEDSSDENDETFSVTLSNPSNAVLGTSSKTVTITDDDSAPTVSITGGANQAENAGTVTLTVSLGVASGKTVTVDYATADGTATASSDYSSSSGTLTFNAGETTKSVTVSITSDAVDEIDETFSVDISNPSNAVLGTSSQTVTITDDDPFPTLSISGGGTVAESSGTASLTVSLDTASSKTITVDFGTASGTATTGSDFTANSGTFTFTPGQTTKAISVTLLDDTSVEFNEDFTVSISNPSNAVLGTSSQTVTITDSDVYPTVSISGGANIGEGASDISLTISLNQAYDAVVTVDYATSDGTASAGSDYVADSGTISFAVGETSKLVTVSITDDSTDENDETLLVTISNPSNAILGTSSKTVTITDDDAAPTVSISGGGVVAESAGSVSLTVSLDSASAKIASINFATSAGTAQSGSDFVASSGSLVFTPGQTSKTVTISIVADGRDENNGETFSVALSAASNCILGTSSQTVSIDDSDPAPVVSISGDQVAYESVGSVLLTLTLNTPSNLLAAINLNIGGNATEGTDFTVSSSSITFSAGQTSKTVTVFISNDNIEEDPENAIFGLVNPTNCGIGRISVATVIIEDTPRPAGCSDKCSFSTTGCSIPTVVNVAFETTTTFPGVTFRVRNCGDPEELRNAPELSDVIETISIAAYDSDGNKISPFLFSRFNPLTVTFPINGSAPSALRMIGNGETLWRDATATCGLQPVQTLTTITFYLCHLTTFSLISTQPERDPLLEWSFQFFCGPKINPIISGLFTELYGLQNKNEWECERYTSINGRETTSCLPSQLVTAPIIAKRSLSMDDQFWNWRDLTANGKISQARQNCTVLLFDRSYTTAREFKLFNAWPSSVEIETIQTMQPKGLHGPGTQAAMEVITIIHEGFGNSEEPLFSILAP